MELETGSKVTFFRDGRRTVDYVLVYSKKLDALQSHILQTYLQGLHQDGIETEEENSIIEADVAFIKLHSPENVTLRFAESFDIELTFQRILSPSCSNKTADPDTMHPTSAETGAVLDRILEEKPFGDNPQDYGLTRLLKRNILLAAYVLHDKSSQGDRQILAKKWATIKAVGQSQPLDLIERYYGPSIAFYFTWFGFYNKMLAPLALLGCICFVLGVLTSADFFKIIDEEVCKSSRFLCPWCIEPKCHFERFHMYCTFAKLSYLLDNHFTVFFAVITSIWSTLFVETWKRKEQILQIRWNVISAVKDFESRIGYLERARRQKMSKFSGQLEPYVPWQIQILYYVITAITVLFIIGIVCLGIIAVMIYQLELTKWLLAVPEDQLPSTLIPMIVSLSGALISTLFILLWAKIYDNVALWLTVMENPRTQSRFDSSYIFKYYAFAFVNSYTVIFYVTFFKGTSYTFPGDDKLWTTYGGLRSQLCDPFGCIVDMAAQLFIIMVIRNAFGLIQDALQPYIRKLFRKRRKSAYDNKSKVSSKSLPQWEKDYSLETFDKYALSKEYMQLIIQYGFVTFFVAGFPFAPLLALCNNLIEMRLDAYKLVHLMRRPIAKKTGTLGAWDDILKFATYFGITTNALVIAFKSHLVGRQFFRTIVSKFGDMKGYYNNILSEFDVGDYKTNFLNATNGTTCFYPGYRNPPSHPDKYGLRDDYWNMYAMRAVTVVIVEHLLLIIIEVLTYIIPDVPLSVKQQIGCQRNKIQKAKIELLEEKCLRNRHPKMTKRDSSAEEQV